MAALFETYITNLGKYNEGELVGETLKFPTTTEEVQALLKRIGVDGVWYQTSKKIRQVFDYKRRNGQYIGSFAPYGYIKDPKDKHQLIVDPEAAEIVKLIYNMTLQGESRRTIVYHLNDL